MNPVHILKLYLFTKHFNIILSSKYDIFQMLSYFTVSGRNLLCTYRLFRGCYMPCPSLLGFVPILLLVTSKNYEAPHHVILCSLRAVPPSQVQIVSSAASSETPSFASSPLNVRHQVWHPYSVGWWKERRWDGPCMREMGRGFQPENSRQRDYILEGGIDVTRPLKRR